MGPRGKYMVTDELDGITYFETQEEAKKFAKSEEDVLSYAMFPQVAKKFFETRDGKEENSDDVRILYVHDPHSN